MYEKRGFHIAEAREDCKDGSKWHSVVFAYLDGKKAWMYVCMKVVTYGA